MPGPRDSALRAHLQQLKAELDAALAAIRACKYEHVMEMEAMYRAERLAEEALRAQHQHRHRLSGADARMRDLPRLRKLCVTRMICPPKAVRDALNDYPV
jgi:hypothetical protein